MLIPFYPWIVWLSLWIVTRSTEVKILVFGFVLAGTLTAIIAALERADREGRKQ